MCSSRQPSQWFHLIANGSSVPERRESAVRASQPDMAISMQADSEIIEETYEAALENVFYDAEGAVRQQFIDAVAVALEADDGEELLALIGPMHESELGDLLEAVARDQRSQIVRLAGDQFDFAALTEVDEAIRLEIVEGLPNQAVALAVQELDSDDAVFILEDLETADRNEILEQLPFLERIRLRRALEYPEETAGRRMQTEFIAVPPYWTVGQTIDYMRDARDLPVRFLEIFVVEPSFELIGTVALDRILRTRREIKIRDLMQDTVAPITAETDQEDAAMVFERYDLVSAAVIDESGRLVGVLTIDDVVDVIHQEADEDIKRMGGVGDEELSDSVMEAARSRFVWLLVNLGTAVMASAVIGLFDATIEQMVALAILMPIVASMGGNAGTQTMTVTVRALATREIDAYNTLRIARREMAVGLLNGLSFALITGIVTIIWFAQIELGAIIAAAMIVNMFFAAAAGFTIPIALSRFGADPAIASTVFVTTVTDVVGFFAFLGMAAWWFGLI